MLPLLSLGFFQGGFALFYFVSQYFYPLLGLLQYFLHLFLVLLKRCQFPSDFSDLFFMLLTTVFDFDTRLLIFLLQFIDVEPESQYLLITSYYLIFELYTRVSLSFVPASNILNLHLHLSYLLLLLLS